MTDRGRSFLALGALSLFLASGCSSRERPGYIAIDRPSNTSAGTGGEPEVDPPDQENEDMSAGGAAPSQPSHGDAGKPSKPPADFDPHLVYSMGSLEHVYAEGVLLADAPDSYLVGISYEASPRGALLQGSALLYPSTGVLRRFVPDAVISAQDVDIDYPSDPTANDPVVDTPGCSFEELRHYGFLASPSGRLIYFCSGQRQWYEGTEAVYGDTELAALLDDGFAVANLGGVEFNSRAIVNIDEPITERPIAVSGYTRAIRSHGDGFRLVVQPGDDERYELWQVAMDGSAESLGEYPPPPDNIRCRNVGNFDSRQSALDTDDWLYQWCQIISVGQSALIRRSLAGSVDILYADESFPYIQGGSATLITGP